MKPYHNVGLCLAVATLVGCTGIPVEQIEKASQPPSSGGPECSELQSLVELDPNYTPPPPGAAPILPGAVGRGKRFYFLVPAGQKIGIPPPGSAAAGSPVQNVGTYDDFDKRLQARLDNSDLPQNVRDSSVTKNIFKILEKSFAQAQIEHARAHGYDVTEAKNAVAKVSTSDVSKGDLKNLTQMIQNSMSHPAIKSPGRPAPGASPDLAKKATKTDTNDTFASYFVDFYEGKFYDRFGNLVTKPTFTAPSSTGTTTVYYSVQISDSDITASLTVLLEYLVDLIDPTPVLTDADIDPNTHLPPTGTKVNYYPHNPANTSTTNQPEALKSGLANYKNIKANTCGVTIQNSVVLYDAAAAAGDSASTVSGLVAQSWGGVGFSLGGFLKFSLGDNQTLGSIIKTAASRLAQRAALASSYLALERIGKLPPPPPGAAPAPESTSEYFTFSQ